MRIGETDWVNYTVEMNVMLEPEGLKTCLLDTIKEWQQNYYLWELDSNGESWLVHINGWSRVKLCSNQTVNVNQDGSNPNLTAVTTLDEKIMS